MHVSIQIITLLNKIYNKKNKKKYQKYKYKNRQNIIIIKYSKKQKRRWSSPSAVFFPIMRKRKS